MTVPVITHLHVQKVQCALTAPGALERFLSQEKEYIIGSTFVSMYPLDNSDSSAHAGQLTTDRKLSRNYIFETIVGRRGHNIYGGEIPKFLASILMERIQPPSVVIMLLSSSGLDSGGAISELVIFRTCLWWRGGGSRCEMPQNEVSGWSFKTKHEDIDEMSVVKGYGCFDTPLLFFDASLRGCQALGERKKSCWTSHIKFL